VGTPRSVVFAEALSQRAIFAAVRAGRVFVDVGGTRSRSVDLRAVTAAGTIPMGGVAALPHGREFVLEVETRDVSGATLEIVRGDRGRHSRVSTFPIESEVSMTRAALRSTGCAGWLRADVRSASGELLLVSNPVYFSAATPMRSACSPDSKAP
jgi:hypothetical protein